MDRSRVIVHGDIHTSCRPDGHGTCDVDVHSFQVSVRAFPSSLCGRRANLAATRAVHASRPGYLRKYVANDYPIRAAPYYRYHRLERQVSQPSVLGHQTRFRLFLLSLWRPLQPSGGAELTSSKSIPYARPSMRPTQSLGCYPKLHWVDVVEPSRCQRIRPQPDFSVPFQRIS